MNCKPSLDFSSSPADPAAARFRRRRRATSTKHASRASSASAPSELPIAVLVAATESAVAAPASPETAPTELPLGDLLTPTALDVAAALLTSALRLGAADTAAERDRALAVALALPVAVAVVRALPLSRGLRDSLIDDRCDLDARAKADKVGVTRPTLVLGEREKLGDALAEREMLGEAVPDRDRTPVELARAARDTLGAAAEDRAAERVAESVGNDVALARDAVAQPEADATADMAADALLLTEGVSLLDRDGRGEADALRAADSETVGKELSETLRDTAGDADAEPLDDTLRESARRREGEAEREIAADADTERLCGSEYDGCARIDGFEPVGAADSSADSETESETVGECESFGDLLCDELAAGLEEALTECDGIGVADALCDVHCERDSRGDFDSVGVVEGERVVAADAEIEAEAVGEREALRDASGLRETAADDDEVGLAGADLVSVEPSVPPVASDVPDEPTLGAGAVDVLGRLLEVAALDAEDDREGGRDADSLPEADGLRDAEGDPDALRDVRALPLCATRDGEADPLSVPPRASSRPKDSLDVGLGSERTGVCERVLARDGRGDALELGERDTVGRALGDDDGDGDAELLMLMLPVGEREGAGERDPRVL